jgi:O-antigen/teichoic acid export membrane protein
MEDPVLSNNAYVKTIFKNMQSNFIRNLLISALTFISSIVYARSLGPQMYGDYTYITWLVTTAAVVFALGIPGTITKFMPDYYYNNDFTEARNFYTKTNRFFLALSMILFLIMGVTSPYWAQFTGLTSSSRIILLWAASFAIVPTLMNSIGTSYIQAIRAFDYYAKINVLFQLLQIGISIAIVFTIKSILWMVIILIITNLLQFLAYDIYFKKNVLKKEASPSKSVLKDKSRIINYSWNMYINIIWQQIVWTRSEFFFLGLYSGSKAVAIYGLAFSLNAIINTVFAPIMNVLVNHFSELVSRKEDEFLRFLIFYSTKYFNLFLIPIFYIALTFYKPILTLVYSNTYRGVGEIFPLLFFATLFSVVMSVGNSIPFYYEKQKFIIAMGLVAGVLNIALDMTLIPKQGYLGAAIANMVSQILFTLIAFIYNIKSFEIKYPNKFLVVSNLLGVIIYLPGIFLIHSLIIQIFYVIFASIIFIVLIKVLRLFDNVDKENYQKVINMVKKIRSH